MKIKLFQNDEKYLPVYKTSGSSCADIHARGDYVIRSGDSATIPVGLFLELPMYLEAQIRPRSGFSKKNIRVAFGTIDSDYRGEICVTIYNESNQDFNIFDGDRIAQIAIYLVLREKFEISDSDLSETERGSNGFCSTGV